MCGFRAVAYFSRAVAYFSRFASSKRLSLARHRTPPAHALTYTHMDYTDLHAQNARTYRARTHSIHPCTCLHTPLNTRVYLGDHIFANAFNTRTYRHVRHSYTHVHMHTRTCTCTHGDYTPGHTHTHSLHPLLSPYTCSTRIYTDMPLCHTPWPFSTPTLSLTHLWCTASHAHGTRTWHRGTLTRTWHTHMTHLIRFASLTWHTCFAALTCHTATWHTCFAALTCHTAT